MGKEKSQIGIVVIGHVDAGKSTTTGHLLLKVGAVDSRVVEKLEKQAAASGKDSFKFAWVLDDLASERERGVTINTSCRCFESKNLKHTIIDAPGHRDFIKNMITGATQADAAMLMLTAAKGEFEAGWSAEGQTKEHALLAYTMGVKQLVVCVNKMDSPSVKYSESRFQEIKVEASKYLAKCGFKMASVPFVPVSGWEGDNLVEKSDNMKWYTGPTLLEALDSLVPPQRPSHLPLRLPVDSVYKIGGVGTVATGRVEAGTIKQGMDVSFAPAAQSGKVGTVEMHHSVLSQAGPGDNVGFNVRGVAHNLLRRGDVCGEVGHDQPEPVEWFEAQVILMPNGQAKAIRAGYTPVVDCHTAHVACRFDKLVALCDKKTGKVLEENPEFLQPGQAALVRLVPIKPMVVEPFAMYAALGRFAVRDGNRTVAVGVVKKAFRTSSGLVPAASADDGHVEKKRTKVGRGKGRSKAGGGKKRDGVSGKRSEGSEQEKLSEANKEQHALPAAGDAAPSA
eukprot:gb/GEZN01003719.1/.p1 GENE.gb/GEZN01003719.1/~~gb/GEZN01003719.1/.p1  ORF type:complete len:508 (+),score=106.03 gb/GEZN01003719.1/:209-1732(+)